MSMVDESILSTTHFRGFHAAPFTGFPEILKERLATKDGTAQGLYGYASQLTRFGFCWWTDLVRKWTRKKY